MRGTYFLPLLGLLKLGLDSLRAVLEEQVVRSRPVLLVECVLRLPRLVRGEILL